MSKGLPTNHLGTISPPIIALALAAFLCNPTAVRAHYADGMNLYQYARSSPATVRDFSGLDTFIVYTDEKANETPEGEKENNGKSATKRAKDLDERIDRLIKEIKTKPGDWTLNGEEMNDADIISHLNSSREKVTTLPKGAKEARDKLSGTTGNATANDQVDLESHRSHNVMSDETSTDFPGGTLTDEELADVLTAKGTIQIKGKIVLGTCDWRKEEVDAMAKRLKTQVGASGKDRHPVSTVVDYNVTGKKVTITTIFDAQDFKSKPK